MDGIRIKSVEPGSICDEGGIIPGDILLSINGSPVRDVFDYRFLIMDEQLRVAVMRGEGADASEVILEVEKEQYEDIGLDFETYLMDQERSCTNDCIFCFIDQMPKGMRPSLYFKDDDARLSFLSGNYVTMTNMKYDELDRIIKYRLSPINVSVHATEPELRCRMMHNRFAGDIMDKLRYLTNAGITVNCQIVLCRGVNDGDALRRSLTDLMSLGPELESVAVVPAGLTDHREGLAKLEPHDAASAAEAIDIISEFQQVCLQRYGTKLIYPSDEFFLLAGRPIPEGEYYEGYPQLDNGVGMIALFREELQDAIDERRGRQYDKCHVTVATGMAFADELTRACAEIERAFPGVRAEAVGIVNDFFGHHITVAGLLTATDIAAQLRGRDLGDRLILSRVMLKADQDIFLDDQTPEDLSKALGGVKIDMIENGAAALVGAIID